MLGLAMKTVFSVTVFFFTGRKFNASGWINLTSQKLGLFSSLQKAENMMMDYISSLSPTDNYIAYYEIRENRLNQKLQTQSLGISEWESIRTYNPDGSKHYESLLDDNCICEFHGNDEPGEFSHGDVILYMSHRRACLRIVRHPPMTKTEWLEKLGPGVAGDWTDDSYLTYDMRGEHYHNFSPYVFKCPSNINIPDKIIYSLKNTLTIVEK